MIGNRAVLLSLALTFALAAPVAADETPSKPSKEDKELASARFNKAVELYKAGDVRAALIEFRRAYKLAPTFHLLFNIGQASAELRDYVDAYNSFTQYLRDGGAKISDERREMVERELERLKGYLARVQLDVSVEQAEITIDGVAVGTSPLSEPLLVSAGRRQIAVTREGYSKWERSVDLAGEDETTIEVKLIPLATDKPEKTKETGSSRSLGAGFWVSAGLTVAFGVGAGAAGVLTLQAKGEQDQLLATIPAMQADIDAATAKTRRMALYTDIGLGLTAIAGVTTLLLARRSKAKASSKESQSLDFVVGPNRVALIGRF